MWPQCLDRSYFPGHLTGSAWLVSTFSPVADVLLTHHRKLDRWLQLGGHADGDPNLPEVALREAGEESGIEEIARIDADAWNIFDLDIHEIPARREGPDHEHFDIRFAFTGNRGVPLVVSAESHDLAWVPLGDLASYTTEASMHRMRAKWEQIASAHSR